MAEAQDGVDPELTVSERIGKATMDALDLMANEYPGCSLESIAIVFAIQAPDGWIDPDDPDGEPLDGPRSLVSYYAEDPRRWVQRALLAEALDTAGG